MIGEKKVLAIIPARAGSKRLKNKNIKMLAGKPLIKWTIDAALGSIYIDEIYVSSDSLEVAKIVEACGIPFPELRPTCLATDDATTNDVISYVVESLKKQRKIFDYIILLQPTSPLRTTEDIDKAINKLYISGKRNLVSLSRCEHSPLFTNTLPDNESLEGFIKKKNIMRAQDLPTYYRVNGAIYIFSMEYIGRINEVYCEDSIAFISKRGSDVDIDTIEDFKYAEYVINSKVNV
ncbi:cytidylyltransferase domain-containing protein [Mixta tenebrionis]|uniref:Acylneuraminate cytidylyltransferase family protein n=1 Tax=Mixta tenebrionis TaxID=2562439 RepID=A0A506VB62_9GAMM|nr:acylneuraminate cytidylyltransferase family protein [Mixta tenebrionis]TPW42706.1 acylneuraminate cytidylyltransferase family protein [Mixta tenebrionis]